MPSALDEMKVEVVLGLRCSIDTLFDNV